MIKTPDAVLHARRPIPRPLLFVFAFLLGFIAAGISATNAMVVDCVQPPSDLVSWWPGDNSAMDIAGSNDGTLRGDASFAAGKVGEAFSLNGDGDYVEIPDGIISSTARNFTVDAWVYPNDDINSDQKIVYGGAESGEYQLLLSGGKYHFGVHLSSGAWSHASAEATANTWAFVSGVRRGSTIELWVDGSLKETVSIGDLDLYTATGFYSSIGSYNGGQASFWNGLIDEVEIFSRALDEAEIVAIFNADSDGKCKVTVAYDANGATGGTAPATQIKRLNVNLTLATNSGNLERTGYTFSGWNTAANGSGTPYGEGALYTANEAVTLYASWAGIKYTVTFDANGGTTPVPSTKQVHYGEAYGDLATTTRDGYAFNGWFTAASGGTEVTSATTVATADNHTLYAQWTINTYTLTVGANPGAGGTVTRTPDKANYDHGEEVQVTATANAGYAFTGWSGNLSGNTNPATVTMDANKTITANFGLIQTLATGKASSFQAAITKIEMLNDQNVWVQVFAGSAQLDLVSGGTFPGISGLDLAPGTYTRIRVTFKNTFPTAGTLGYGGTSYYTTAVTFNGQTNLASTATTIPASMAAYTFRIEAWGALNADVVQEFAITPITVDSNTDYRPTLRFTLSNRLGLMGVPGSPDTYYFTHSTPGVRIVE